MQNLFGLIVLFLTSCGLSNRDNTDWAEYLGGIDRNHYSALTQIDSGNIASLKVAWEFHTGDSGQMQCSPIVVDGILYGVTASNQLFALNAGTGAEMWRFNPDTVKSSQTNRGVAFWRDGNDKRILYSYQSWLYAVDAITGKPVKTFGNEGRVSLQAGLGRESEKKFVVSTTPGTIYKDIIIMPIRVGEGVGAAPGYIQAFNVVTGKLAWVFKTIPQPGEKGYETWPEDAYNNPAIGGANNWAGMALDKERGIVYVPTGSASFDFYGGNRKGTNLFANCILALDAATGKYIWHYQTVRHDIWDRDLPAPPNLITINKDGKKTDAVAQVTKSGYIFILDRETGAPLFPIDEFHVPASDLPGEEAWPSQPVPRLPKPFARQHLNEDEITTFSDKRDSLLSIFRNSNKGLFHPLTLKETILFPGADGGAEWGGAAVSPEGIMYINSNEMAWVFSLSKKNKSETAVASGHTLYNTYCSSCHKSDLSGSPESGFPALAGLKSRMKQDQALAIVSKGKGMMPGFTMLDKEQKQMIVGYLYGQDKVEATDANMGLAPVFNDVPYEFNGYNKFLDEQGYPAITPPWGTLTAIDLNTGEHRWQLPLGEEPGLKARGITNTGVENYGGPLVTASGLIIIAATKDAKIRAFNQRGKLVWEYGLPAAGFATPITYSVKGKQYIAIACGGAKLGTSGGGRYIAFAFP
ncbi:MAG TPA: PQQ-binding-like beta-propeller repeat protein [Niabella sp.]|nr:PQQ-binding-like beta-propeller repeat protein [Niabella sp.]